MTTDTTTPAPVLDLDAIEARVSSATPAAWSAIELVPNEHFKHSEYWVEAEYHEASGTTSKTVAECTWSMADAEFIAHARTDVPELLAEVKWLRARLAEEVQVTAQATRRAEDAEGQHQVTRERLAVAERKLAARGDND